MAQKNVRTPYQHLFFDLDHTLWDMEKNSHLALTKMYEFFALKEKLGVTSADFIGEYKFQNERLWKEYRDHKVSKSELRKQRFLRTLAKWDCADEMLALLLDETYLEESPRMPYLIAGARELLEYLQQHYQLHIITNGFKDATALKLKYSNIQPFFKKVITSDEYGANKPAAGIFVEAMKRAGAKRKHSIMIGDNLHTDIAGAQNCGLDQVYYNPGRQVHSAKVTFEVAELREIQRFF